MTKRGCSATTRLGQGHPRLSPSRACVPRSLPAGMQGVWHWAKGPLFPGQGVWQGSRAWEGGRGGGATGAERRRQRLRQVPAGVSLPPPWRHSPRPASGWDPRWLPAARARTLHAAPRSSRLGPGAAGVLLVVPVRGPGSARAGGAAQQLQRASPARAPPVRMGPPTQLRPPYGPAQVPPPAKLSPTQTLRPTSLTPPHHTTPTPHGSTHVPPPEEPTTTQTPLPVSTPALHPLNLVLTPIFAPIHSAPSPTLSSYIPRPIFFNHAPPTLHGSAHSPAS